MSEIAARSKQEGDPEIAFIFGAGGSIDKAPAQSALLESFFAATAEGEPAVDGVPEHVPALLQAARLYLERTFPGPRRERVPYENVVGPLEISEAEEYWFHYAGASRALSKTDKAQIVTNRTVLDGLDAWLVRALDPPGFPKRPFETAYRSFYSGERAELLYGRLLSLLTKLELDRRAVFVSMNYDVLLDRAMLAASGCSPDYRIDAFIEDRRGEEACIPLLKVHGSLNWRVCDSCHVLRNFRTAIVWPRSECRDCGERDARPMLIRPTVLKNFRHRVWQDVWREAGRLLRATKHWVFIGYSLPLADVWMLRLVTQAFRAGGGHDGNIQVTVVDPDSAVHDRFRVVFPDAEDGGPSFGAWVERSTAAGSVRTRK